MRYFLTLLALLSLNHYGLAQTELAGQVTSTSGEALIGANVRISKEGVFATGASTNFDGNYQVNLDPGIYNVDISYIGYADIRVEGLIVEKDKTNRLDVQFQSLHFEPILIHPHHWPPLIEMDKTSSGKMIRAEQVSKAGVKTVQELAGLAAGVSISQRP